MERKTLAALAVLMVGLADPAASQTLTVRVYNNFGVPTDELRDAREQAGTILSEAGINIVWHDCWYLDKETPDAPARCRERLGSGEIMLRVQRSNAQTGDRYTSLGFTLVGAEGVPFLATVYADLVASVSRGAGVRSRVVLGCAIAHEIGHVLLNSNSHPGSGLMRATWSRRELQRGGTENWRFQDEEAARMRAVVVGRAAN